MTRTGHRARCSFRRSAAVAVAVAATIGAVPAHAAPPASSTARHDVTATTAINNFLSRAKAVFAGADAVTASVWRNGAMVKIYQRGTDNSGRAITTASRFRLASISKVPTMLTVMRLVELGKIKLDTPLVQQWKPARTPHDPRFAKITVRQLLRHTSGVPELWNTFFASTSTDWRSTADSAVASTLRTAPGSTYFYANANYTILGRLIERVTGLTYTAAVQRYVLGPLGISDAILVRTGAKPTHDPVYRVTAGRTYLERLGPAGAWAMSAASVAKLSMLRTTTGGQLLTAATQVAMRVPGPPTPYPYRYGLGTILWFSGGWGHTGNVEAVRTFVRRLPNGYVLVVMASIRYIGNSRWIMAQMDPTIKPIAAL